VTDVEEHLLVCADCQQRLAETEAYLRAMRRAAARARAKERRPVWKLMWVRPVWAFAAVVLVLAAGAGIEWRGRGAGTEIALEATRGPEAQAAPAGAPLRLSLDATGLPEAAAYRVEVVDEAGREAFAGRGQRNGARIAAAVPKGLCAGRYFIRVYGQGLLREYGLAVMR
jgi:hypothetical protein